MFSAPYESIAAKYVIKTHYIMRVIGVHPETQTVDLVQIVPEYTNAPIGDLVVTNDFGMDIIATTTAPDVLQGIPIVQLRWGKFSIQAMPQIGDTGYIEVFTNDIQAWIREGEGSLPWTDKHFLKQSCVFVPFVADMTNVTPDYPDDGNTMLIKSDNAEIVLTDDGTTSDVKIKAKTVTMETEDGVNITGDVNITGGISVSDDIDVEGKMKVEGKITANGDVDFKVNESTTVSLSSHVHTSAASGSPTSGPTVAPTTP